MRKLLAIMATALLCACGGSPQGGKPADGKPEAGTTIAVVNGDFEQSASDGNIPGWKMMQHAGPPSYEMAVDADGAYGGHGAFRMSRTHEQIYGSLVQDLDLPVSISGELELSAMMKTKDVGPEGWKLMLVIADTPVYSPALTGNNEWQRISVRAKLPANSHSIRIGAMLLDAGTGWLDDVQLRTIAQ
jgi:hypothetical protein